MPISALPPLKETRKPPEALKPFKPSSPPKEVRKKVFSKNIVSRQIKFKSVFKIIKNYYSDQSFLSRLKLCNQM